MGGPKSDTKKMAVLKPNMLLLWQALAEFIGTALFFIVILTYGRNPIAVAIGLLAAIYAFGRMSGGHFNSAVSVMLYMKGDISAAMLGMYITAQLLGAVAALAWWRYTNKMYGPSS